jgi:hypothetical protein
MEMSKMTIHIEGQHKMPYDPSKGDLQLTTGAEDDGSSRNGPTASR